MKPKIVVVGSANTDMVVQVEHLPAPGETILGGKFAIHRGGKGANQAVAAARLGADVTFVARLGRDSLGQEALAAYQAEGIRVDHISFDDDQPSGVALIMVNQNAENIIAVASGANGTLSAADVLAAEDVIRTADVLLLQLEVPLEAVQAAVNLGQRHGVRVILNPAPAAQLPDSILSCVDVLTPNENETLALAGEAEQGDARQAAPKLLARFGLKQLVVTMGSRGALAISPDGEQLLPAFKIQPVDTTGAGDAFNGGLAVALARGDHFADAIRFASAVGALSATRAGAQTSLPSLAEVEAFLAEHPE